MRKDIGEIVRLVKDLGISCKLNTNGYLLQRHLEDMRRLDLLQISLDGPDEVQDQLRGAGSFRAAVDAALLAKKAAIPTHLTAVFTRHNVGRLDEVLDLAAGLGVGVCFQPMVEDPLMKEGFAKHSPRQEDLIEGIRYLIAVKRSRGARGSALRNSSSELDYFLGVAVRGKGPVECALLTATLDPDGQLYFCRHAKAGYAKFDATSMGFRKAFSMLTIPECDGCRCIGRVRFARLGRLDLATIVETFRDT